MWWCVVLPRRLVDKVIRAAAAGIRIARAEREQEEPPPPRAAGRLQVVGTDTSKEDEARLPERSAKGRQTDASVGSSAQRRL